jgi:cytochrome c556
MTTTSRSTLLLSAAAAASLVLGGGVAAVAHGGNEAVEYRQGIFHALKWNIGPLAAMAKGEMAFDAAEVETRAGRIATLSTWIVEGFPEGSDVAEDTAALPKIWDNKEDFASKAGNLNKAAAELVEAAPSLGGASELGPLVGQIGQACKACHDEYRED